MFSSKFAPNGDGSSNDSPAKGSDELTVNSDTFRRWKEASMKSDDKVVNNTPPPPTTAAKFGASPKTADWPEEDAPIRIIDDAVAGMDFGGPVGGMPASQPETKVASIGQRAASPAKTAGSKFAQFVSGFGAAKTTQAPAPAPTPAPAPETPPTASRTFSSPVPGSNVQSDKLNSMSVDDRKQLFKEEEQLRSSEDDIRQRFGANLKSALSSGTIIEGKFKFDSPVRIDGTLMGEVQASSLLIVGGDASVEAKVRVGSLVVLGVVRGNVEADELVEIKRGGLVEGDIKCARFAIEEGGWFQGKVTPTSEPKPRTLAKKIEKVADQPQSSNSNGYHAERRESEQLSLGSTGNISQQTGAKASWS